MNDKTDVFRQIYVSENGKACSKRDLKDTAKPSTLLKDGQKIRVDGTAGKIVILDPNQN